MFKGLSADMMSSNPEITAPQRGPEELRVDFIAYMKSAGCRLTRAEADIQLPAAGFTTKELRPVIGKMLQEGEAVMHTDDDSLSLSEEV